MYHKETPIVMETINFTLHSLAFGSSHQRCSAKTMFLKILLNSQEITVSDSADSDRGVFLWTLQVFKNIFFHRITPAAASESSKIGTKMKFVRSQI